MILSVLFANNPLTSQFWKSTYAQQVLFTFRLRLVLIQSQRLSVCSRVERQFKTD